MIAPTLLLCLLSLLPVKDTETQLIQDHLWHVETTLRDQDVSHLPAALRAKRSRSLDALQAYWQAGVFPKNTAKPGARVPVFVDHEGTACAMAHVIKASGHTALVRRIAQTQNFATIWEIQDPELPRWLASHGLSAQEAAWIQPSYAHEHVQPAPCPCTCDFAPVHAHGITYLNECVSLRCGGEPSVDQLAPGCAPGTDDVVTGWMVESQMASLGSVCTTLWSTHPKYDGGEQSEAFVKDVCAAPTPTLTGDLWWTEKPEPKEDATPPPSSSPQKSGCKGCATAQGGAPWQGQGTLVLLSWGVLGARVWRRRRSTKKAPPRGLPLV